MWYKIYDNKCVFISKSLCGIQFMYTFYSCSVSLCVATKRKVKVLVGTNPSLHRLHGSKVQTWQETGIYLYSYPKLGNLKIKLYLTKIIISSPPR